MKSHLDLYIKYSTFLNSNNVKKNLKKITFSVILSFSISSISFAYYEPDLTYKDNSGDSISFTGFMFQEINTGTNRSSYLQNCAYAADIKGVGFANPPECLAGPSGLHSTPTNIVSLISEVSHEFDSAWKVSSRFGFRVRNGSADFVNNTWIEKNFAISHPKYGELRYGTMLSRSWARSDSFTYALGLSPAWSETGAGYGVYPQAVRYTTPSFDFYKGNILFESTFSMPNKSYPYGTPANPQTLPLNGVVVQPPSPELFEFFTQYSQHNLLLEYVFQGSRGGYQSSFGKGPFVGAVGNTDNSQNYITPNENLNILQGEYYFKQNWKLTFGLKRSYWSGSIGQCDYNQTLQLANGSLGGCITSPGFNTYGVFPGSITTSSIEYDALLGVTYTINNWAYSLGGVRLNKAYINSPVELGQSNSATYVAFEVSRTLKELSPYLRVYSELGFIKFDSTGPSPISMPSNISEFGVDPRTNSSGINFVLGTSFIF